MFSYFQQQQNFPLHSFVFLWFWIHLLNSIIFLSLFCLSMFVHISKDYLFLIDFLGFISMSVTLNPGYIWKVNSLRVFSQNSIFSQIVSWITSIWFIFCCKGLKNPDKPRGGIFGLDKLQYYIVFDYVAWVKRMIWATFILLSNVK